MNLLSRDIKSFYIGVAVLAFVVGGFFITHSTKGADLALSPAPCDVVGTPFLTITQNITNDPDSGNSGNWATDAFTEKVTVWLGSDNLTYCANANTINGTFVTTGPLSPEQGLSLPAGITGTFTGGENYTLPSSLVLNSAYSTASPQAISLPDSSTAGFSWWVNNAFPSVPTSSGSSYVDTYSLTYIAQNGSTWTDADSVSGGDKGDITPVFDANTGIGYANVQTAVTAASAGDTINVAAGTYNLTAELDISKPLSIVGNGVVTLKAANTSWDINGKHILGIYAGTQTSPITISNVVFDCNKECYGLNTYNNAYGVLSGVTVENSKGAALTVNGSTIVSTNLNTSGNAWGAVNVDPGVGVTTPSVFTFNSGTLGEARQIWSDGSNVTNTATVTVNASGYNMYKIGGTTAQFFWTNRALTNAATITKNGVTTYYSTIQAAVTAASAGDTINVAAGSYTENLTISNPVHLLGPNATVNPNTATRGGEATITGTILDYAGSSDIKGFTITNPNYTGSTIEGVHIYSAGPVVSNINVENNIFSNIANAATHGSYAVMVQGVVSNVSVSDNKVDGITSAGWAHAIEVTPTCNSTTVPQSVTVDDNVISSVKGGNGDSYGFSADWCDSSNVTDASQITFHNNSLLAVSVRNLDAAHTLDATNNYWGSSASPSAQAGSGVTFSPWFTNSGMTILSDNKVIPDSSGNASVDNTNPQVVISSSTQTTAVTIDAGTNNPTIDVSAFITAGTGTLPQISITAANAGNVSVAIPASTVVTSADSTWNGIIAAPTLTTVTLPAIPGEVKTLSTAIEVGFTGAKLSFDKAVRLLLPGQAGKRAGYVRTGTDFTEITSTCASDSQAAGDALAADEDCKIDAGSDLAIWTKHFTTFAAYTQEVVPSNGGVSYTSAQTGAPVSSLSPDAQKVDLNKDGSVNGLDFSALMAGWGQVGANNPIDFNGDGKVDILDFVMLMANWTK